MSDHSTVPSLQDIAMFSGVSARTLQRAFHLNHGTSVMAFVKRQRLERVNRQLMAADPNAATVTEIANANGFVQMGRFSAAYRHQFGELPSETLRL